MSKAHTHHGVGAGRSSQEGGETHVFLKAHTGASDFSVLTTSQWRCLRQKLLLP